MSEVFHHKRRTLDRLTKRQKALLDANRKAAEQAREMAERERRAHELELERDGEACALGALAHKRGIDTSEIDAEDPDCVGAAFGIARSLAAEIEYENDEANYYPETPEERWQRMRAWVASNIEGPSRDR